MSLDAQIAAMFSALKRVRGSSVTYRRAGSSAAVTAVIGRTVYEAENQRGVVEQRESVDFLVASADLKFGVDAVTPARGDTITNAGGEVFEVLPLAGADQVYRRADPAGNVLRIHTARIGTT